ncbi:alpha/beta hydrolase [Saccharothrix violaceirubra]|uniref:Uncharacterized protein n=1 Tax=Saccharothrix violaceirubra TaxID=413306 RepID=A0A7W7T0K2_9PSEU|nr:hypothetical protein [Saccharothrix violaceirubra]MBB4963060.1 hypothetical protein [Saccharothrix violaceirubra]
MRRLGILVLTIVAMTTTVLPARADTVTRYEGEIDGAKYRVMVPSSWNGTLVLWSHGAYGVEPPTIALTDQPATEEYLLSRGYALAASKFRQPVGWSVEDGPRDQLALLDWFRRTVGPPRRTISAGESAGGATATVLAERNAHRFSGVLTLCGAMAGSGAYWNSGLDVMFAVKTLLGADFALVKAIDPAANEQAAYDAVDRAVDPAGAARVALAAALGDVPAAFDPTVPAPTELADRLYWARVWVQYFRTAAVGTARADLERRAGGNPSGNLLVDYRRVLDRSGAKGLVVEAYRTAGLDLDADLDRLAAAPRVTPDLRAVAYLGVPLGFDPWPVVTVHNRYDGVLPLSNETVYARRALRPDNLRQYAVDRAGHCRFTASEEITAFESLFHRLDTGTWRADDPATQNTRAAAHGPERQTIRNPLTGQTVVVGPAFTTVPRTPYPREFPF